MDHLLLFGEKMDICDRIMESSGMGEDEESASPEEYVKTDRDKRSGAMAALRLSESQHTTRHLDGNKDRE